MNRPCTTSHWPRLTLLAGTLIILLCQVLLLCDVRLSGRGALHLQAEFDQLHQPPVFLLHTLARFVAINLTPLNWLGYLLLLDGLLTCQTGTSPARKRPHHLLLMTITSITIWCVFDWVNFYFIHAWSYLGLPENAFNRAWSYIFAFGAIVPGMLMSGQLLLNAGLFDWARTRRFVMPRWIPIGSSVVGIAMFAWPLLARDPVTNLTLWTSLIFLLDPINFFLGRPSMWRDWQNGWFGRTLAAFAGGLVCGLLWEFWNYWALAKWVYHLPFLGSAEQFRYFEMPAIGLLGFLPFGLECWIMWQFVRIPLDGLVEPLPGDRDLL